LQSSGDAQQGGRQGQAVLIGHGRGGVVEALGDAAVVGLQWCATNPLVRGLEKGLDRGHVRG